MFEVDLLVKYWYDFDKLSIVFLNKFEVSIPIVVILNN
jgi:hypothetical protein